MAKEKPEPDKGKEEKQVPEKPKRKPADTGIIQLVGIIAGTVVVMVIVLFLAFKFLIYPDIKQLTTAGSEAAGGEVHEEKKAEKSEKSKKNNKSWMDEEDTAFFEDKANTHFIETGRITTNPKGTTKQFVVINLGLIYMTKPGDEEHSGGGEEGEEGGPSLPPTTTARIKHGINMILGKFSADQLKAKQDSLPHVFKNELKPIFKQKNMLLRDVIIQEIIIQ